VSAPLRFRGQKSQLTEFFDETPPFDAIPVATAKIAGQVGACLRAGLGRKLTLCQGIFDFEQGAGT
jgi:hypothetical protein